MSGYKDLTSPNNNNLYCRSITGGDATFNGTVTNGSDTLATITNQKVNTSFSGPWATPQNCLISYGNIDDSIVVAYFPAVLTTGTNALAASCAAGSIPIDHRPATNLIVPMYTVIGNGDSNIGSAQINADGSILIYGTASTHVFSTGTSVGWDNTVVTWKLS